MIEPSRSTVTRNVRVAVAAVCRTATDGELLRRFVERRTEAAFAALVERHGPMVLRVCRRVLHHAQDAEDAFQATFLVLAQRADSIHRGASLASWLHGVAHRIALRARADAARRRHHERNKPAPETDERLAWDEVLAALDEELARLPEDLRTPLVLCYLEGRTQDEAARQLGWALNTLRRHLAHGRELLGLRLGRRGIGRGEPGAEALVSEAVTVADELLRSAVRAGVAVAAGARAAEVVPAGVAALAEGGLGTMTQLRLKTALAVMLALGAGAGLMALPPQKAEPPALPAQASKGEPTDRFGDPLPLGAVVRMGTVRLQHRWGPVVFTADGKDLISAGADDTVRFWDPVTGRLRKQTTLPVPPPAEPGGFAARPHALSADGKTVVVDTQDALYVMETATGKVVRRIPWSEGGVYLVAMSPDGRKVVMVRRDGREAVRIWDTTEEGEPVQLEGGFGSTVLVFSPDGRTLVTRGGLGVQLWDTATGREVLRIKASSRAAAFSPDGRTLGLAEWDGDVSLWETATGKERCRTRETELVGLHSLLFSPDGKTLAVAGEKALRLFDAATLKKGDTFGNRPYGYLAFTPDGKTIATTGPGAIQLWDVATGKPLHDPDRHTDSVNSIAWSPDGRFIASLATYDPAARLWDAATGIQLRSFRGHQGNSGLLDNTPGSVVFGSEGRGGGARSILLATGGHDGSICVWDAESGREVRRYPGLQRKPEDRGPRLIRALHLLPETGGFVALRQTSYEGQHQLIRWEADKTKHLAELPAGVEYRAPFTPDGRQVVGLDGSNLALYDVDPLRRRVTLPPELTAPAAFASDGRFVAARSRKPKLHETRRGPAVGWGEVDAVCLVERTAGRPLAQIETGWVGAFALSPDGRYVATAGGDAVRLWEVATGRSVHAIRQTDTFSAPRGASFVRCMAFSPDGRKLATGMYDTTVLVWDLVGEQKASSNVANLWDALAGEDGAAAYRAGWQMVDTPERTVAFLKKTLRPATAQDPKRLRRLLADLDSDEFAKREAAAAELLRLGEVAESALRDLLRGNPSAEVRRRGEALLEKFRGAAWGPVAPGETLAALRAVGVLEHIGSQPAVALLRELARGEPTARLTREAKASLARLTGATSTPSKAP